jgi:tetraacyldisaccharide 4'-kinase
MAGFRQISRPALLPLSPLYGLVILVRNLLFDLKILKSTRFKLPVISVGNIAVGGTGKTPHVEYLVSLLKEDYKIAVLSRGYKRKTKNFMLASVESSVADIGDEPLQIKLKFPDVHVAVDRDRVKGVNALIESIPELDLVVLDDAYQHRYIQPGLSILLIDYNRPVFRDVLLPAGNLREPCRNLKRASIIMITKCPDRLSQHEMSRFISNLRPRTQQKVYFTKYNYGDPVNVFSDKPGGQESTSLKHFQKSGTSLMLVTGIANPNPLKSFLKESLDIRKELTFPDHHPYTPEDFQLITKTFQMLDNSEKIILTTEKDAMRIRNAGISDINLRKAFYYLPVEVEFLAKGEKPFIKDVYRFLNKS